MAESCSRLDVRTIARVAGDVLRFVSSLLRPHVQLAAENLFLRKQLALYLERQVEPRRADDATRIALVALSRLIDWRRVLTVVKPDTLIRWHRKGFRLFWRWKSSPGGRPRLPAELRELIAEMAAANRTWGEEKIASELLVKLGIRVSPVRFGDTCRPVPDPTGARLSGLELFVRNHARAVLACDFRRHGDGDVPRALHLRGLGSGHSPDPALERNRPSDGGVDDPAVPNGGVGRSTTSIRRARPRQHLLRGCRSDDRGNGVTVLKTPVRAPQANAFCERLIGTIRRECLDFIIPPNEQHVRRLLREWIAHYNRGRPHSSLGPGIPEPPPDRLAPFSNGHQIRDGHRVVAEPVLGDLHHEYRLEPMAA
jgi:putative transposase